MVDADRVKLMTRMASYEANEGKYNKHIGSYFRSDYLALQTIKSFIYGTLAYLLVLAIYVIYDLEVFMQDIYNMDLLVFAKGLIVKYIIFIVIYAVLSYVIYARRYHIARKSLRCYYNNLNKLSKYYEVMDEE